MFAELPVGVAGPRERLTVVAHQMIGLKGSGQSVGVESMLAAADFVPATLMTLGAKVSAFAGQRVVNTVTTNIPGPQHPLYLLGHRMLELFPYIPLAQTVRISIGILSYDGHLTIGVTGDYDAVPDIDVLCAAIESSWPSWWAPSRRCDGARQDLRFSPGAGSGRLDRPLERLEHPLPVRTELLGLLGRLVAVLGQPHRGRAVSAGELVDEGVVVLGLIGLPHERAVVSHRQPVRLVDLQHLALVLVRCAAHLALPGDRAAHLPVGGDLGAHHPVRDPAGVGQGRPDGVLTCVDVHLCSCHVISHPFMKHRRARTKGVRTGRVGAEPRLSR